MLLSASEMHMDEGYTDWPFKVIKTNHLSGYPLQRPHICKTLLHRGRKNIIEMSHSVTPHECRMLYILYNAVGDLLYYKQ